MNTLQTKLFEKLSAVVITYGKCYRTKAGTMRPAIFSIKYFYGLSAERAYKHHYLRYVQNNLFNRV